MSTTTMLNFDRFVVITLVYNINSQFYPIYFIIHKSYLHMILNEAIISSVDKRISSILPTFSTAVTSSIECQKQ